MRLYLKLTKNKSLIPFNYQHLLTGVIHKWLGKDNAVHGAPGQISFSWLQNTEAVKTGLNLKFDGYFFISALDSELIKQLVKSILKDPEMFNGIVVKDVQIVNVPTFPSSTKFLMGSPVLLKWKEGEKMRYVTIEDEDFEAVLTKSLSSQLSRAGISSAGCKVSVDPDSTYRSTKLIDYKGIKNKASLVPLLIEGNQEQIAFAWCTGLGNSTGIGFGALK